MDLYPKDFTEQLEKEANEIKEFVECLKKQRHMEWQYESL